jgi:hypothetical protein
MLHTHELRATALNSLSLTPSRLPRFSARWQNFKTFSKGERNGKNPFFASTLAEKRGSLEGVRERGFKRKDFTTKTFVAALLIASVATFRSYGITQTVRVRAANRDRYIHGPRKVRVV